MANKTWDAMTVDEKLDALRQDIQRLFDQANRANGLFAQQGEAISDLFRRLEKLEKQG